MPYSLLEDGAVRGFQRSEVRWRCEPSINGQSILEAPVQHVPGEYKTDDANAGERDQPVPNSAPQPAGELLPGSHRIQERDQRAQNSDPAHQLNQPQPGITLCSEYSAVLEPGGEESHVSAKEYNKRHASQSHQQP